MGAIFLKKRDDLLKFSTQNREFVKLFGLFVVFWPVLFSEE
jgi:hypothetical protein